MKNYAKKVRLVFRQMPLASIHKFAQKAAEASLCADAQGRFWEMHDLLFQDQINLGENDLKAKAAKLGLDPAVFNKCLDGDQFTFRYGRTSAPELPQEPMGPLPFSSTADF